MSTTLERITIQVSSDLREYLEKVATAEHRSLSAECAIRLEKSALADGDKVKKVKAA